MSEKNTSYLYPVITTVTPKRYQHGFWVVYYLSWGVSSFFQGSIPAHSNFAYLYRDLFDRLPFALFGAAFALAILRRHRFSIRAAFQRLFETYSKFHLAMALLFITASGQVVLPLWNLLTDRSSASWMFAPNNPHYTAPIVVTLVSLVGAGILAPLSEEITFRGFLLDFERNKHRRLLVAIGMSSFWFMMMHPSYEWADVFVFACIQSVFYLNTNNIAFTMLTHAWWNFYVFAPSVWYFLFPSQVISYKMTSLNQIIAHGWGHVLAWLPWLIISGVYLFWHKQMWRIHTPATNVRAITRQERRKEKKNEKKNEKKWREYEKALAWGNAQRAQLPSSNRYGSPAGDHRAISGFQPRPQRALPRTPGMEI